MCVYFKWNQFLFSILIGNNKYLKNDFIGICLTFTKWGFISGRNRRKINTTQCIHRWYNRLGLFYSPCNWKYISTFGNCGIFRFKYNDDEHNSGSGEKPFCVYDLFVFTKINGNNIWGGRQRRRWQRRQLCWRQRQRHRHRQRQIILHYRAKKNAQALATAKECIVCMVFSLFIELLLICVCVQL